MGGRTSTFLHAPAPLAAPAGELESQAVGHAPPGGDGGAASGALRILFVAWRDLAHPKAGGSEVVVDRLIEGLRARGHRAALVCGGPVGRRPYPVLDAGGTYGQYLRAPLLARRFRHWDLLVDVANGLPFFSPLWWRGPRLCFFHHLHDEQWQRYFPRPVADAGAFVERRVLPALYRSTRFAAVSPSTAGALRAVGVPEERIDLVHNGLDAELLAVPRRPAAEPTFVVLSRLAPNKGVDRVLDAWARVRPTTGGRLVVIGDGPERDALAARRVPGVELLGRVDETTKRSLISSAWLLVHGAHQEGWGMAIMEAAAQGVPTLAFDVDGVRDSVVDGATGLLADDLDDLTARWAHLATDPVLRAQLGETARHRAASFGWDRSVDELLVAARRTVGARR